MTALPTAQGAWPGRRARLGWRPLALGVLWGLAVSAMESANLPLPEEGWSDFWSVMLGIAPGWSVVGVGIAFLVELAGDRVERPASVIAIAVVSAIALSALWSWLDSVDSVLIPASGIRTIFPHGVDPVAAFAYQAWIVLFYGGLYFVAWRLNRRAERTRNLFGQAEIARIRAETLLGEAQLQLLRGRVEPQLLLRVLAEVERRYARDGPSADKLLALLVAFLRLAMPVVRSGRSTLRGELALARAYGELCANLEPACARWTIAGKPPPSVPFPPLLMLPLLDALAGPKQGPVPACVCIANAGDDVVVRFCAAPSVTTDPVSADLLHRLRVGLATLYGNAWSLSMVDVGDTGGPALVLVLRPRSTELASVSDAPGSFPSMSTGVAQ